MSKFQDNMDKLRKKSKEDGSLAIKEELSSIQTIMLDEELKDLYAKNASVGSQNLGMDLPLLKIHSTGKSKDNKLLDGSEPNNGWFFYKPEQKQYETPTCHILTVSRGFKTEPLDETKKEKVFNQIVGGVIVDGEDYKPFLMYFTGTKLSYLWEFAKSINKYTKSKELPIPMFALTVRLKTKQVETQYGNVWVVDFDLVTDSDGNPTVITDIGKFTYLKDNVETLETTIESIINNKEENLTVDDIGF